MEEEEHKVYGGEILDATEMEGGIVMSTPDDDPAVKKLDEMKRRLKEIEEEVNVVFYVSVKLDLKEEHKKIRVGILTLKNTHFTILTSTERLSEHCQGPVSEYGSVVVTNQTAAQNNIQNSNIENIRQDSGNNNNGNQTVNSGGNNHGPRHRITQPPFNSAVNAGWPPYGLPHNYSPPFLNSNFGNNSNPAF
ncbi:hypothetical protein PIB30_078322 [Stylosanthes scabra]|uniref:Uncharacterized protein n=1 Tax=Stylosanthes scabra TaxID=79078 RepID=A0ABU6QQG0_9FABA|nr:hypothetical protein [Stylosanthes scabra]